MDRGTRRDRTNRIIAQRFVLHRQVVHSNQMEVSGWTRCVPCEHGTHFWATHHPMSCHCTKRAKGRPKVGRGMCCCGDRKRVYRWRNEVRELNRLLSLGWEEDSDRLVTLWSRNSIRG